LKSSFFFPESQLEIANPAVAKQIKVISLFIYLTVSLIVFSYYTKDN